MKQLHNLLQTAFLIFAISLCAACDKMPDNGQLDGMWQLMSIENSGGQTIDTREQQRYWSFRLRLVQYTTSRYVSAQKFYAHFSREGGAIVLKDFCQEALYETETDDNEWVSPNEAALLHPWGVYGQPDEENPQKIKAVFHVEVLSDTQLVLKSNQVRLIFRKF